MIKKLRESLRPVTSRLFQFVNAALLPLGYKLSRRDAVLELEPFLYHRLNRTPDFFFVQIGANDGVYCDPIHNFVTRNRVRGIAVEPLKDVFSRLVENYRSHPQIKPINVAIHPTEKEIDLHRVDPKREDEATYRNSGMSSIRSDHHALSGTPMDVMIVERVRCMSLDELLKSEGVTRIDLLQIDTEGFDFEIIKMIDFNQCKPHLIHFEHGLPDGVMKMEDLQACITLLTNQGYYVVMETYDVLAYLRSDI